jgi:hypothetical protein
VRTSQKQIAALTALAAFLSAPAVGQWLNYPTAGVPRLSDGKANLAAPAPRTPDGKPDLSGLWEVGTGVVNNFLAGAAMHLHPFPRKVLQFPGLIAILFEKNMEYRQIFTDGRPLPVDPQPSHQNRIRRRPVEEVD